MRLSQVYLKMTHAMTKHLRRWDRSLAHCDVLVQGHEAEGLMQQKLAHRLSDTKGNVCYRPVSVKLTKRDVVPSN